MTKLKINEFSKIILKLAMWRKRARPNKCHTNV